MTMSTKSRVKLQAAVDRLRQRHRYTEREYDRRFLQWLATRDPVHRAWMDEAMRVGITDTSTSLPPDPKIVAMLRREVEGPR
jgi:hypothetical protein